MKRAAVALLVMAAAGAAVASAQGAVPARLQGTFQMSGRIVTARDVRGERRGMRVVRTWTFAPQCPTGTCATVVLNRARARGADTVTLHQRDPGHYSGRGHFYAPLRCGGRTYRHGARVPFMINVWITTATDVNGTAIAQTIHAWYVNVKRINLTPCVAVLGHDAARYHGTLVAG